MAALPFGFLLLFVHLLRVGFTSLLGVRVDRLEQETLARIAHRIVMPLLTATAEHHPLQELDQVLQIDDHLLEAIDVIRKLIGIDREKASGNAKKERNVSSMTVIS